MPRKTKQPGKMKRPRPEARPEAFIGLMYRCIGQVYADPSGYTENLHLLGLLRRIYLRLCHGDIAAYGIKDDDKS